MALNRTVMIVWGGTGTASPWNQRLVLYWSYEAAALVSPASWSVVTGMQVRLVI